MSSSAPAISLPVSVIPAEFYAGQNPVVTFRDVKKEIVLGAPATSQRPRPAAPGKKISLPVFLTNKKYLIIAGVILFVLFVVGSSWYYWVQARRARRPLAPPPVSVTLPPAETPPPVEAPTATPEIPVETPTTTEPVAAPREPALIFPSPLLGDNADADKDALTDAEEELFGTDPEVPDTDSDKYPDGHEVYNLYNPAGQKPIRLIESGVIKEFANPVFPYRVYYPLSWALGNVDVNYRTVLFSTITGENIEVRVLDKPTDQSFADWFAWSAPGERFSDLVAFESVFKQAGWRRPDYLVYYFMDNGRVYVITYHTTNSPAVNYRSVIKMLARSFRLSATPATPELVPRLEEGSATSTEASETEPAI